jgi:hypothetical protein
MTEGQINGNGKEIEMLHVQPKFVHSCYNEELYYDLVMI